MTTIDIFSGFLGAGKTTLIKKLIAEAFLGEKLVLIENEFGEIGIDGGFMKDAGIQVMIVSNNRSPARVEAYCHDLGISYVGHAGKPKRGRLMEAMRAAGATPETTALVGDQIFTDVLGARRCGFHSFCVEPVCGRDSLWHWIAYWLQNPFRIPARRRRNQEKCL